MKALLYKTKDFWLQIFYIEFNSRFEKADQKVLLEWFRELTVPAAKDATQADSNAKAVKDSGEWYSTAR